MTSNKNLSEAKKTKNDEFYTEYSQAKNELDNYIGRLDGMSVICPADGPESNIYKYLKDNFEIHKLKKLTAVKYVKDGCGIMTEYDGHEERRLILDYDGSIVSERSQKTILANDVMITNPPFSLYSKILKFIYDNNVKFILISSVTTPGYKLAYKMLCENRLFAGWSGRFIIKCHTNEKQSCCQWITSFDFGLTDTFEPTETYEPGKYPVYDYYPEIIYLDKIKRVPKDYDGLMAVPVTAILYIRDRTKWEFVWDESRLNCAIGISGNHLCKVNSKSVFKRFAIKKCKPS